jgi:hypothetical protein
VGRLTTVVSGGQTGVDQAALRAARACGLEIGGWCPPGRESEAGVIPADLPLRETPVERSSGAPEVPRSLRTEWNVRDSDATLILRPAGSRGGDPGTDWAARCALRYGRPLLICDPGDPAATAAVSRWLGESSIRRLSVGGPSESAAPGIGRLAYSFLVKVLAGLPSSATRA